jgi:AAA domain
MTTWSFLNWDNALSQLNEAIATQATKLVKICGHESLVVLRDWQGRITLCMPCSREALNQSDLSEWVASLGVSLGLLASAPDITYCKDEFFDPHDIWMSPNLVALDPIGDLRFSLLDRQDKENDWLRKSSDDFAEKLTPRAIFFGVKGGVGRSSALTSLALKLAESGKKVLIIDADFESPGVSSIMLDRDVRPDYGLIDWFTAHALGADPLLLSELISKKIIETSPLSQKTNGLIKVAPSHGALTQAYVSKLGRIYRPTLDGQTFAQRLSLLITELEKEHDIDVTLVDSRAGIDDTGAAAITQLQARAVFLFAMDTSQTWDAYELLFKHLTKHLSLSSLQEQRPDLDFRRALRMVSAMTPEEVGSTVGYLESFKNAAYDTCANIYDKIEYPPNDEGDDSPEDPLLFAPAFADEDAPHAPMLIMWDEVLRGFDPVNQPGQLAPAVIAKAFGDFLIKATKLLE